MEAYWNKLTLDRPPTTTWCCAANDFDCKGFLNVVQSVIRALRSQTIFATEAAILSRVIYRMKSKLRSDKGLKNMEKVNRALLNYLKLSLEDDYKYLLDNIEATETILALPSKQMLQYVLTRTQGFAKLMCRIETVAWRANNFFKTRINLGQAWNMSLVAYAVVGRIWMLSRCLTKKCCTWYKEVYRYHNELKIVGVPWLPEKHCFPEDLETWLNVAWINEDCGRIATNDSLSSGIFGLISQNKDARDDTTEFGAAEEARHAFISEFSTSAEKADTELAVKNLWNITESKKRNVNPVSMEEIGKPISRTEFAGNVRTDSAEARNVKKRKKSVTDASMDIPEIRNGSSAKKVKFKKRRNFRPSA